VGKAVAIGGALIGGAMVAVGLKVFDAGSQFEAMDAKAQTVFGDSLGTVQKWAKTNAGAMGLTVRAATGLAASMGDLLIPMGFTRDEAAKMSTGIVGLSGALSEWTGGTRSAADVSAILQKALLGEREGLKELGISITEADVKARLLKNGTDGLTGAALEQAKALATQQLIMEKTTDAQAAYEAGTAKGIRTQNEMKAMIGEVVEKLIVGLYPVVLKVAGFLKEQLPKAINFAKQAWKELGPTIKTIARFLGDVAKVVIPAVAAAVGALVSAFRKHWPAISSAVSGAINTIRPPLMTIIGIIGDVGRTAIGIVGTVLGAFNKIVGFVLGLPGRIAGALGRMFSPIWTGFKGAINSIIRGWNSIKFTMPKIELPFFGVVGGFTIGTPDLPYLHRGGIVPGVPGSDVMAMLQAGERVVPRSQAQGQGITIIVEGDVYGDGIDRLADKLALRLRLQGV
jgi:hypothetical protein